jgi:branched-chain amino acid transport system substrate-binding protein
VATKPEAKIGVLYQNDSFGKDYLSGLRDALGADHGAKVIKEASFEIYEPTVDSQVGTLQGSGADVLLIAATDKFAAQAIRRAFDIDWTPTRYLAYPARSVVAVMKPAGLEKSKGVISANFAKDPTDPRWKDDPGMKQWQAFCAKYLTQTDLVDANAANGFTYAAILVQVLKQCGDDLSREKIMRQATNLKDIELPLLLPGVKVNTSPTNYSPIRQMQLATFNGESWELFGEILEA